jgi:TonB-linked SusC/RagA family outer membrane protein
VNVYVPGTTVGTTTNRTGRYQLDLPPDADSLTFSFIGYRADTVAVAGRSVIDVALQPQTLETDALVVTALGIERESRTIGYSVQEVDAAQVAETADINVMNSLQGKLAGVRIEQSGTGQGGSTRIVIRGNRFIGRSNQPLFVVDGIPIQGGGTAATGAFGGFDYGGGISDIDPNSVKSITVLRGANAAALYGAEAANGAVIVETKKGTTEPQVTFASRTTVEQPLLLPDLQNAYGRGSRGTVCGDPSCPTGADDAPAVFAGDLSWGPRMEGQPVETWTGEVVPFTPQPDNVEDLFDTAYSTTNSLSFSAGTETVSARASLSNLQSGSLLPDGEFDRTNLALASSADLSDRLTVDGRVSYVTQSAFNRPQVARSPDNVVFNAYHFPRNLRLDPLRDFQDPDGAPRIWTQANFSQRNNPFWSVNLNTNQDSRDRLLGFLRLNYEFTPWLSAFVRGGTDYVESRREVRVATNTSYKPNGAGEFRVENSVAQKTTYDVLVDAERDLTETLHGRFSVGGSWRLEDSELNGTFGRGLSIPNLFTPSNLTSPQPLYGFSEQELRSVYGLVQFRYRDYLFLDLTARNDWASTLPEDNNSYFYPSVTAGFIFSDLLTWEPLSFGKLRASAANVGDDASPFQTNLEFSVEGDGLLGRSFGSLPIALPPVDLVPQQTSSYEAGVDLGFFDDRVEFSGTYYRTSTTEQIVTPPIAPSSGFRKGTVNAGEIRNDGIELRANGTVLTAGDFQWNASVNWAKNWSEVVSLTETLPTFELSSALGVAVVAREGEPFGEIFGSAYARTDDGRRVINDSGVPVRADTSSLLGNVQPDWTGGISNTVRYKNLSLRVLVDVRAGGDIYSLSNAVAAQQGTGAFTLDGREAWYSGNGGFVADGVVNTGTEENPSYEENTQAVDPQSYWTTVGGTDGIAEEFVYDGSFVKLREIVLSYRLPESLLGRLPVSNASVSVVGRNLAFLHKNTPGFDPESTFGTGFSDQGREAFAFPQTRSLGVNLNLTF